MCGEIKVPHFFREVVFNGVSGSGQRSVHPWPSHIDIGHAGCGYIRDNNTVNGTQKDGARLAATARRSVEAVAMLTGPDRTLSRGTNQDIQWLPTTISIKCREPKCACNASRKKKPGSCPALEGQVHLSGDTQYVRALGKIFEAGGQPVKNREMKSLAQKGNQDKFCHRTPGIQRSPVVYNFQHLREYN